MFKYLILLLSLSVLAQTPVSLSKHMCAATDATTSRVVLNVPATVTINGKATNVSAQVCAKVGSGLSITTAADGSVSLNAALPPTVTLPKQVVEKFTLPSTLGPADASVSFLLSKSPAPNTSIVYLYRSSNVGSDVSDAVTPIAGEKNITISLPSNRPFTSADIITFIYWTND